MYEFDGALFRQHMHGAVVAHSKGRYEDALGIRTPARGMALPDSSELGRVLRDDAADYDRLGRFDEADVSANEAFRIHNALVEGVKNPGREAYRERSASGTYIAANGLRRIIKTMQAGERPTAKSVAAVDKHGRGAWSDIREAKKQADRFIDRRFDQYEINQARRVSMAATITGHRTRGLRIAAKALLMSPFSEARWLGTSDRGFTPEQRHAAKRKAALGGVAALGIGTLMTSKPGRRQSWIVRQADRAL